jgi:hypothetical protein
MNAQKWNDNKQYEHIFSIGFSVSTDKPWELVTPEEIKEAIERKLAALKRSDNELMEAVWCEETLEYEVE